MANGLSALAIFNEQTFTMMTEVLDQQVQKFNGASDGTLILRSSANKGSYNESTQFAKIASLVRRRDPESDAAVASTNLSTINDISVKVTAGSVPVRMDPAWFAYIQESPELAAAALSQQLALATMEDMLNVAISAGYAAIAQTTALVHDGTATTFKPEHFVSGSAKFGDRAQAIRAWIMHSKPVFDMYAANMANSNSLFNWGSIIVSRDPFGRSIIITDSPSLVTANGVGAGIDKYHTLGLVSSAITVEQNNDFNANIDTRNGNENIQRTYQSEWSYNLSVKGYKWDVANGGKNPSNVAIATSGNWDKCATSNKDTAGVLVESR